MEIVHQQYVYKGRANDNETVKKEINNLLRFQIPFSRRAYRFSVTALLFAAVTFEMEAEKQNIRTKT